MSGISTNLGRVGLLPKGEYDAVTPYVRLDIVSYEGSAYVALKESTGTTPGTDETTWQLLAQRGDQGPRGADGDNGTDGLKGEKGTSISQVELQEDYTLKISLDDGTDFTTTSIRGEKGEDGNPGPAGPMGPANIVKGSAYASLEALQAEVMEPAEGDQYNVGTEAPYNVYRYTGSAWEDQGKTQGPPGPEGAAGKVGDYYLPTVTEEGMLSWEKKTGDTESEPPGSVKVKGDDGAAGQKGDTGDYYLPSVSGDGTLSWEKKPSSEVSELPASVKIKGDPGKAPRIGEDGTWETWDDDQTDWVTTGISAVATVREVTVPADEWASADLFSKEVSLEGISPKDAHIAELKQTGTEETDAQARAAWAQVTRIVAEQDKLTVYALKQPSVAMSLTITTFQGKPASEAISTDVMIVRRGTSTGGGGGTAGQSIEDAVITLDQESYTYDGSEHEPKVTSVKLAGTPLTEWEDYVQIPQKQTDAGTYEVVIMGTMEYSGSARKAWTIDRAENTVTVSPTELSISGVLGSTATATLSYKGDGAVTVSESTYVTSKVSGKQLTLTSVAEGSDTLTITVAQSKNYLQGSTTLSVQVQLASKTLEDNTWDVIASAAAAGTAKTLWSVGDKKSIQINGKEYHMQIIGFDHDDLATSDPKHGDSSYNGGKNKAAITFQMEELYAEENRMDETNSNACSWRDSEMRTSTLETILGTVDADAKNVMRTIVKKTATSGNDPTIISTDDKFFFLSEVEVFGNNDHSAAGEGENYEYYKAANERIKKRDGTADWWWLRSPRSSHSSTFLFVSTDGTWNNTSAYNTNGGIAAGFCV